MSRLYVSKVYVSKLYVSKLCVSKLCVSKLCVSKLCVSKLCVSKLCVEGGRTGGRADERTAGYRTKNKNPTQRCGEQGPSAPFHRWKVPHFVDDVTAISKEW